jgi:hypothetical protein
VMAECFKIVPGAPGDNAAAESITMIKYTALRQQVRAGLSAVKHYVQNFMAVAADSPVQFSSCNHATKYTCLQPAPSTWLKCAVPCAFCMLRPVDYNRSSLRKMRS